MSADLRGIVIRHENNGQYKPPFALCGPSLLAAEVRQIAEDYAPATSISICTRGTCCVFPFSLSTSRSTSRQASLPPSLSPRVTTLFVGTQLNIQATGTESKKLMPNDPQ